MKNVTDKIEETTGEAQASAENQTAAESTVGEADPESPADAAAVSHPLDAFREEFEEWFESGERETAEIFAWFKSKL